MKALVGSRLFRWSAALNLVMCLLAGTGIAYGQHAPFLASGVKTGEADQNSVVVWVRLTKDETANFDKLPILSKGLALSERSKEAMPADVVPGMDGQFRIIYWLSQAAERTELATRWISVDRANDFIAQVPLKKLHAGTEYRYRIETRRDAEGPVANRIDGQFKTAPASNQAQPIRFIVSTCQAIRSIDDGPAGHVTYRAMLDFDPHFFVHTGDIVYYDKVPFARNESQARAKWQLMFSYGHNRAFHRHVTSYFMKDDHDTLKNDCWPGQKYGELTFEQGLKIFRQQVPMREHTYRTGSMGSRFASLVHGKSRLSNAESNAGWSG